jgi:hypothetical protein
MQEAALLEAVLLYVGEALADRANVASALRSTPRATE